MIITEKQQLIDTLISDYKAVKKEFQEKALQTFKELMVDFFNENPGIKAVKWAQYSPYFNDGEECVFSVNSPTFTNAEGEDLDEVSVYGDYDGDNDEIWATDNISYVLGDSGKKYYEKEQNLINSGGGINVEYCNYFSELIQSSELEDIFYDTFGNHAQVTVTKDGIDVDDYDHD